MISYWFWFIDVDDDSVIILILLKFKNYFLMFFSWFLLFSEISMLVIESRFFFHILFYEKSTFANLASSGSIRRNLAISRINWLGNNFFFLFRFFLFFYGFHRSRSLTLTLNLKFGLFYFYCLFLGEWGCSILGILLNRTLLFL